MNVFDGRRRPSRWCVTTTSVALLMALTGCGSQLNHAQIVADHAGRTELAGRSGVAAPDATRDAAAAADSSAPGVNAAGGAASDRPSSVAAGHSTASSGSGAATLSPIKAATLSPIKVGHIGTYSGLLGAIFKGGRETAQSWAKSVNERGGLAGHPVQLVTGDDGGDPSKNLDLTRDMVENQGVIAFVGNIVPLSILGSKAYLEQKQIPLVGGDLVDTAWFKSPMFFPQGLSIEDQLRGTIRVGIAHAAKRFGLLYCAEASACTTARDVYSSGLIESLGAKLVFSAQISLAQPDFTSECIQLRSNRVDTLFVAADGNTYIRVARACKQQAVTVKYLAEALALVPELANDPDLEGLVGIAPTFPWMLGTGPAGEYQEALHRFAPGVAPGGAGSAVWSAAKLMEAASRSLPANAPQSKDILNGLYALKGETLGGLSAPLSFVPGHPATSNGCFWPIALRDGKFVAPTGLTYACPK